MTKLERVSPNNYTLTKQKWYEGKGRVTMSTITGLGAGEILKGIDCTDDVSDALFAMRYRGFNKAYFGGKGNLLYLLR